MTGFSITDLLNDPLSLLAIGLALLLGGTLKGAIGIGSPVIAVPVMASFFDVRLAIIIMVGPNLVTNLWQFWAYRAHRVPGYFGIYYALAGALGALIGTVTLTLFSAEALKALVAAVVILYVGLRVARPDFALSFGLARKLAVPVGVAAGILQGAAGISAPLSASLLSVMRIKRDVFIATISLFFVAMCLVQIPTLLALGLMTWDIGVLSAPALALLILGMRMGQWVGRRVSPEGFDRIVIVVLLLLAFKLLFDVFA